MNASMLVNWTDQKSALMDKAIVCARHRLHETDLFTDDRLIAIIDAVAPEKRRVNTTTLETVKPEWRDGDLGDLSGREILEAVRSGRLWLNLFDVADVDVEYREVLDGIYDELASSSPPFRTLRRSDNLLVSSPNAVVGYHIDPGPSMLLHVRGLKRVSVYPSRDSRFISAEDLERVCVGEYEGWEIPYRPEFESDSQVFDLEPGDLIYWPQYSPHRVLNEDSLNVSITLNHATVRSYRSNAVQRVNGISRRRFNRPLRSSEVKGPIPLVKVVASAATRTVGLFSVRRYEPIISFRVDSHAANGFVDCEPHSP